MSNFKKSQASPTTITRDTAAIQAPTGNIYEVISILSKRANQINVRIKEELNEKLEEFAGHTDTLDEVFENREQIEISRFYEKLPKPSLLSIQEWADGEITFRRISEDESYK